jgi:hypothetical protein
MDGLLNHKGHKDHKGFNGFFFVFFVLFVVLGGLRNDYWYNGKKLPQRIIPPCLAI